MLTISALSVGFRHYETLLRQGVAWRLRDFSLTLGAGQIVAVIGASGAGKSVLAHAVLGILPPNAVQTGQVVSVKAGFIPQQISHLDPLARVGSQLAWAARRQGRAVDIAESLKAVGLSDRVQRLFPHQLSGGMARRVFIAMALAGQPDLLIADEPTAGLDPENRDLILNILQAHAARGGAVLLITHDLLPALPVADRVVILHDGQMVSIEQAVHFSGQGDALSAPYARALWRALPENGFIADA
ncbi:ATP-binding cassette domain-containing protein [Ketogulonicigenium vulgare]|uniref:ATP-binding cassette domain-containing protein n=1 Tax=Ketogulonicigenium vulgare TaxID=92945 RepID=UPI0001E677AC|nr:ATP-binding cassette domain-containing protein [Ketogulonicigenium vulgare]ADO41448.1 peptide/opine/nickel uptake ABC transporter family, ATP-binding protein [Ketogulonicigenium vulgare Y25]ALJ79929.1 hypothetical protein KVH_01235 [Ketogulonicigenium vulgare]ANW32822.1 hypothetical protein KvSKV_01240 [Ketogulonicigenium vulgare]AOZ53383.1 peptide/opine/nickel uptake ABC transporter family, ATP-binding protein [Ketogulonicigenium vulgare]